MFRYLKILAFIPLLAACNGGSDEGGGASSTTLDGTSRVANAEVAVSEWNGTSGGPTIASTTTDRRGMFSIELQETGTPVLIEVHSGSYIDPATGNEVNQSQSRLTAVVPADHLTDSDSVSVSGYTSWAHGLAGYHDEQGAASPAAKAHEQITSLIGFDPLATTPHRISSPDADLASQDEVNYGLMNAAAAELVHGSSTTHYSVPEFHGVVIEDLRHDGKLNGEARQGGLFFDGKQLQATTYRHGIAENLLVAVANNDNTNQTVSDILPFAKAFNRRKSVLYPEATKVIPLDSSAPTITNLSHKDGFVVTGDLALSASVIDPVGLSDVSLYIDGSFHSSRGGEVNPVFQVDTSQLTDEDHNFRLIAENKVGATTEKIVSLQVANDAPTISQISPESQYVRGLRTFSAHVSKPTHVGIQNIDFSISGTSFNPTSTTTPEVDFDTTSISNGGHEFEIRVTDTVGNEVMKTVNFSVDNEKPTGTLNLSDGETLSGSATITGGVSDNVEVHASSVLIDGTEVHQSAGDSLSDISATIETDQYPDGPHAITLQVMDHVGNVSQASKDVEFLNSAPELRLDNPLDGDVIESSFQMTAELESPDTVEEPVEFLIDGEVYSTALPNRQTITSEFNINNYPDGDYTFTVKAVNKAGFESTDSANVTLDQN